MILVITELTRITKMMPEPRPPRTCVFVKGLPAGALCEMTLTAAA